MQFEREDTGAQRIATLDIETTHYDPEEGETVAIGLGVHEAGTPGAAVDYTLFRREGDDEGDLIRRAFGALNSSEADLLVTYKGRTFDFEFLHDRLSLLEETADTPELNTPETHLDLFEDRQVVANETNEKWPKLEECLVSYGMVPAVTEWEGEEVDNVRFGEELGPAYLRALSGGEDAETEALTEVIDHYLRSDLEANLAIYYADIGASFEPQYDGSRESF